MDGNFEIQVANYVYDGKLYIINKLDNHYNAIVQNKICFLDLLHLSLTEENDKRKFFANFE